MAGWGTGAHPNGGDRAKHQSQVNFPQVTDESKIYFRRTDVQADVLRAAADAGNGIAQLCYGCMLRVGMNVPTNLVEAARYFKMAADQGFRDAQYCYGLCLDQGNGVPIDFCEAARYYQMAADQGHESGQLAYALCAYLGKGVPVDVSEAARYFKMAADQKNR